MQQKITFWKQKNITKWAINVQHTHIYLCLKSKDRIIINKEKIQQILKNIENNNVDSRSKLFQNFQQQDLLKSLKTEHQIESWVVISEIISKQFPSKHKNAKQCRQKYINCLSFEDKNILKEEWSDVQLQLLYTNYLKYGPKWKTLQCFLPNRSENGIKNKFNCSIRKFHNKLNLHVQKKKQITWSSVMKLIRIVQKTPMLNNQFLSKYKDLRLLFLSSALLPEMILDPFEIEYIHTTMKSFNTDSRCLNSCLGKNCRFKKIEVIKIEEKQSASS